MRQVEQKGVLEKIRDICRRFSDAVSCRGDDSEVALPRRAAYPRPTVPPPYSRSTAAGTSTHATPSRPHVTSSAAQLRVGTPAAPLVPSYAFSTPAPPLVPSYAYSTPAGPSSSATPRPWVSGAPGASTSTMPWADPDDRYFPFAHVSAMRGNTVFIFFHIPAHSNLL